MDDALQQEIASRVVALGYELVELEQAGSKTRPILRLRIDKANDPDAESTAQGVTLGDCTRVSRAIEEFLDDNEDLSERYVLEVSSPGLERPLVKPKDYERFAGKQVAIKTSQAIGELGKRVQGVLRGIDQRGVVTIEVDGKALEVERSNIKKAHLVVDWDAPKKK